MATTNDMVKRVLKRLGALDPEESPTVQENVDAGAIISSVLASMRERDVLPYDIADLPTAYENAVIDVLAYHIADDFGLMSESVMYRNDQGIREIHALSSIKKDKRLNPAVDY